MSTIQDRIKQKNNKPITYRVVRRWLLTVILTTLTLITIFDAPDIYKEYAWAYAILAWMWCGLWELSKLDDM